MKTLTALILLSLNAFGIGPSSLPEVGMKIEIKKDIHIGTYYHNKGFKPGPAEKLDGKLGSSPRYGEVVGENPLYCFFSEYKIFERRWFENVLGVMQNDSGSLGFDPILKKNWGSVLNKDETFEVFLIERNSPSYVTLHLKNTSYWSIPEKAYLQCYGDSDRTNYLTSGDILAAMNDQGSNISIADYTDPCDSKPCPSVDNTNRGPAVEKFDSHTHQKGVHHTSKQ
jgi:hypothetical protein